jgi:hypothetical protein
MPPRPVTDVAQFRVGVTIFRDRLGAGQVDELSQFLQRETGSGAAHEHPDRDIVRMSFVLEADDYDDAQAQAEELVDRAAAGVDWDARPRAVGAVRVATPPVAP